MMFDEPHTAYLVVDTIDKYNAITGSVDTSFSCMIEEGSQFLYETGQPQSIGRGMIFTSSTLTFMEGDKVKISGVTWIIKQVSSCRENGIAHHTEIIYG